MNAALRLHSLALALVCASCARSSFTGFVPALDVGMRLVRTAQGHSAQRGRDSFTSEVYVWLSFRPQSPAASQPLVSDASGLLVQAPCEEGDVACLDEVAESEAELAALREDVP